MTPGIATAVFALGILGLFALNRDRDARTSPALWIPVVWLLIVGSRPVSQWLGDWGLGSYVTVTPEQYLDGSPVDRNVFLVLSVAGLIVLVGRRRQVGALLRANAPILLFFFYCALSTLWSDFPDVTFKRWFKAVGDLMMVLIVLSDHDPLAALKRLLARVGFVLLPLSILYIKYYPDLGREYIQALGPWTPSYCGVTMSKNLLGMITLVLGLGCEWCFLQAYRHRKEIRGKGPLIAQGALLAMVIWLFWMANSATSLSCFVMAGSFLAITNLHKRGRKPAFVHFFVAAVVSLTLFALFADSGGSLLGTVGRDATLTGRTEIWNLVLSMSGNPWFGTGFESFWLGERMHKTWNLYRFHLNEAHNGYIEVYLTLGWIGIALLAALLVTGYRNLLAGFRRDVETGSLKFAYFIAAVIYNFTETGFRMLDPVWIFFFVAIIAVPKGPDPEHPPQIGIDHADNISEGVPEYEHILRAGFREVDI
jgi:exopolysaccharide production protein ExoQ